MIATDPAPAEVMLSAKEIIALFGVDRRTLFRWVAAGAFPKPIKMSRVLLRWRKADIDKVIADRQN
jgi:prophage regulatory protein